MIKGVLAVVCGLKGACGNHLSFQCAMEAFILSKSLWMTDAGVTKPDAKTDHPHTEFGVGIVATTAPRAAVVGQHTLRETITPKRGDQMLLDGFPALI
jgi:hypothetical protein